MTGKFHKLLNDLAEYGEACLWFSGGKDSRLILEALLSIEAPFHVLRFDDGWTPAQKKWVDEVIMQHDLLVYTYQPVFSMMVGNGTDLALVSAYSTGGDTKAALYRDLIPGDECAFDLKIHEHPQGSIITFPRHLIGTKKDETHFVMEGKPFIRSPKWMDGNIEFFAPLFDWTDREVYDALFDLGVDLEGETEAMNTGNIPCCHNCLTSAEKVFCPKEGIEIDAVKWSPHENLAQWREVLVNA